MRAGLALLAAIGLLGAACGGADDAPGGGDGGDSGDSGDGPGDGSQVDASPGCQPTPLLPIAWSKQLPEDVNDVAVDGDGSVVVAYGDDPTDCVHLMRLASDGSEVWRHPYDPSPPPADNYKPCPAYWDAIALAADGTIAAVGDDVRYPDAAGPSDILVRKHAGDGSELWTYYNQNAPDGFEGSDGARDIAVAADGAIVAVGVHASRPWVGRFTPDGDPEWIEMASGAAATEVETAGDGASYVGIMTGEFDGPRFRIARFDADGSETTIARVSLIHPRGVHLAATADGGLAFVLRGETPLLRTIDAGGDLMWEQLLDFTARTDECERIDIRKALAIAVGPDGSIHVELEGTLARYSAGGELLSVHRHDVYAAEHLAVAADGSVALTDRRHVVMSAPLD